MRDLNSKGLRNEYCVLRLGCVGIRIVGERVVEPKICGEVDVVSRGAMREIVE